MVDKTDTKSLDSGPGDHRRVVGAQRWGRGNKMQPGNLRETRKAPPQSNVGRDATRRDQSLPPRVMAPEPDDRVRGAIHQRIADRRLDRGCEIGLRGRIEPVALCGDALHSRLQSGERKIATSSASQRPWQVKARRISFLRRPLDRRSAGITETDQLRGLVESFSGRVVERRPESPKAPNRGEGKELKTPPRQEGQKIGKIHVI